MGNGTVDPGIGSDSFYEKRLAEPEQGGENSGRKNRGQCQAQAFTGINDGEENRYQQENEKLLVVLYTAYGVEGKQARYKGE